MDKRLQKQIEKQMQLLHDQWEQAVKETQGIGPVLSERIVSKRKELAAKKKYSGIPIFVPLDRTDIDKRKWR